MAVDKPALIDAELSRLLTQYRESPKLQGVITAHLQQIADIIEAIDAIFAAFDIETAVGEQLTFLGRVLGWPRDLCAGRLKTVFGFILHEGRGVPLTAQPVAGWKIGEWQSKGSRFESASIADDELFRRFLKARIISLTGDYSMEAMNEAARLLIGPTAFVLRYRPGVIQIATGRALTADEKARVHLFDQVLPVAPGVRLEVWHNTIAPFGFGVGWGGWWKGGPDTDDDITTFGFTNADGEYGQLVAGWQDGNWAGQNPDSYLPGQWPVRLW
jgi:hypothetical protein